MRGWRAIVLAGLMGGPVTFVTPTLTIAGAPPTDSPEAKQEAKRLDGMIAVTPKGGMHLDPSGRKQRGQASFYAARFAHRKVASGRHMNPNSDIAASKTLPLGSVAKVTNLDNGKSATVTIDDRGPFVAGRVVDLTPKVARRLNIGTKGVAPVEVRPITVPQPGGEIKLGAGGADATPDDLRLATEATKRLTEPKAH